MVNSVPVDVKEVDVVLVTPGGLANQVNTFVTALRPRFDVQVPKDRRFRLSFGYSNVPYEDKVIFDKIIDSMKIRSVERDNSNSMACLEDTTWIHVNITNPRIRRLCVMPSVEEIQKQ